MLRKIITPVQRLAASQAQWVNRSLVHGNHRSSRFFSYAALGKEELDQAMGSLKGDWTLKKENDRTSISRTFEFVDFVEAWSFMSFVALKVSSHTLPVHGIFFKALTCSLEYRNA